MSSPPPPLSKDDYSAADPARKRIAAKSRLFSLPTFKSSSQLKSKTHSTAWAVSGESPGPASLIILDSTSLDSIDVFTDKYEWAVVYENQRGVTLFSIPYYSRLSLLPSDPPPFTISNPSPKSKQTNISLDDYPLPDGTWRWVSKCWMIDMRSDTGEVQHDGFEYNWVFRTHKWRAEVGSFSAGGWVRRRRWIRLMMRPAIPRLPHGHGPLDQSSPSISAGVWRNPSVGSMLSRSVTTRESSISTTWIENDVEGNWLKCRLLMKHLDHRDNNSNGKARQNQRTGPGMSAVAFDDVVHEWQCPSKDDLISILQIHGNELLQTFIYPDSRASFLAVLAAAGLLHELDVELGIGSSTSGMDFWSYIDEMAVDT
ncbi:hypothetical protein C0991_000174 [Blastosporella zonata]|nr:hypothetical protein C0991_000174 [Blastosporella zonata]